MRFYSIDSDKIVSVRSKYGARVLNLVIVAWLEYSNTTFCQSVTKFYYTSQVGAHRGDRKNFFFPFFFPNFDFSLPSLGTAKLPAT